MAFKGAVRRSDCADHRFSCFGRNRQEIISGRHDRECVIETARWPIAPPYVEYNRARTAMDSNCCAHSVGPQAVDPSLFESFRQGNPGMDLPFEDLWKSANFKPSQWIDANRENHPPQPHLIPSGRSH